MAVQEQAQFSQVLVAQVDELMVLAEKHKWEEVDSRKLGLLDVNLGLRQQDIAAYILQSGLLVDDSTPNGDRRDCAWTILEVLRPDEIEPTTQVNIALIAETAALTDRHIFAAGRAADLLRLWKDREMFKKGISPFMKKFAERARKNVYDNSDISSGVQTRRTWLKQYEKDIPELAEYLKSF